MKLSGHCRLHKSRGKHVLIMYGRSTHALEVNESFAHIWRHFSALEFTEADVASFLESTYNLDAAKAEREASQIIGLWQEHQMII